MGMHNPLESMQIVPAGQPFDCIAGALTGDYASLVDYAGVLVLISKSPGTAAQDPIFSFFQATTNTGTGAKDLDVTKYWIKQAATNLTTTGQWTETTQSADNDITNATLGEQAALIAVWFSAEDLDADGGFDHFRVDCDDPGTSTSQFVCINYLLFGARYGSEPSEALSAL
jgi:hypothetical protein